ncbi:MAG: hypothetical protein JSS90_01945 [Bacteroidetes bacterium]|jgi:hypothetical protein|nr:hypothetical protein [Bacteroidota bacterium]
MKIKNYVLIASVAINAMVFLSRCNSNQETKQIANIDTNSIQAKDLPCACADSNRYSTDEKEGGGECISLDDAKANVQLFQNEFHTSVKGGFLSKKALDKIFCDNPKANGIVCYLAKTGKEADDITIIVEGFTSDNTAIKNCTDNSPVIFRATAKCPNVCSQVGQ